MPHSMTWERRYRLVHALRTSLAAGSGVALLLAIPCAMAMRRIDAETGWKIFDYSPDGARAVLGVLIGSMLTFIVFVLSATLIVVQLASGQFTPRVIALFFAKRDIKLTLGLLTFTFTYSLAALARIEDGSVPDLHVGIAVILNLVCILAFFYFAQQLSGGLRPSVLMRHVAHRGRGVIAQIYPKPFDPMKPEQAGRGIPDLTFDRTVDYDGPSGVVLAFSVAHLEHLASRSNGVVMMIPQVGDFVAEGDPLFRVAGNAAIDPAALNACVAVGNERTLEQDPRFVFRIIVDMACKALSPAINDPTTAVIALDQIHDLLLNIGRRHLGDGHVADRDGRLRLVFGTPDWPDFVILAVSEIRQFGESSLQVNRRLRAMLEHLIESLPPARRPALHTELTLLVAGAQRRFPDEEDRHRAEVADYQGLGGSES